MGIKLTPRGEIATAFAIWFVLGAAVLSVLIAIFILFMVQPIKASIVNPCPSDTTLQSDGSCISQEN